MQEHLYIVAYDICDDKRLRRVFKLMKGYGEWLQLSIFQCRLSARRQAELVELLDGLIVNGQDHVVMLDLGPTDSVKPRVISLGKTFQAVAREPTIV
ncbi:MAG: CRISPR-associated endonuclease Cas2 [Gammaproteobacteria bacterium]|nr:CRISPR-associated endonuclease Cas2 [Gammaproteobacteria bacterium]